MKPHELEAWALDQVARVDAGQPIEDSRVELKGQWPTAMNGAARRLGGHANASAGSPVLWIIGLDENAGVVGAAANDLARWLAQLSAEFEGLAPELLLSTNVPVDARGTIVALLFDSSRSPYLVRNEVHGSAGGGPVTFEVPYRVGTAVASATRAQVLRILVPASRAPSLEVRSGTLEVSETRTPDELGDRALLWSMALQIYLVPEGEGRIVIPWHYCSARLRFRHYDLIVQLDTFYLEIPPGRPSATAQGGPSELVLTGPCTASVLASGLSQWHDARAESEASVTIGLRPAGALTPAVVDVAFSRDVEPGENMLGSWTVGGGRVPRAPPGAVPPDHADFLRSIAGQLATGLEASAHGIDDTLALSQDPHENAVWRDSFGAHFPTEGQRLTEWETLLRARRAAATALEAKAATEAPRVAATEGLIPDYVLGLARMAYLNLIAEPPGAAPGIVVRADANGVIYLGASGIAEARPEEANAVVARVEAALRNLVDGVAAWSELAESKRVATALRAAYDPLRRRLTELASLDPLPRRRCRLCSTQ